MNNDNNDGSDAASKTGKLAKQGAERAYQSGKKGLRGIIFLIRYWWLGLGILIFLAILFGVMFFVAILGGSNGNSSPNPCSTGVPSSPTDSNGRVENKYAAINPMMAKRIQQTEKSVRRQAPKFGILPSVVLADEFENPGNNDYNYWGVGFDDNTTANNKSFKSVDDGVYNYLKVVFKLSDGHIKASNAKDGMLALAEDNGQYYPTPNGVYHTAPAFNITDSHGNVEPGYYEDLMSQYNVYDLKRYDKGVHLNTKFNMGNLKDIQKTSDDGSSESCEDSESSGNGSNTSTSSIYNFATRFNGKIPYSWDTGARTEFGNDLPTPKDSDRADCSSFVWGILKAMGYKVDSNQWTTQQMDTSSNLQHISANDAKQGDILDIPNGTKAHTMILSSDKWYGAGSSKTRVIDEGGGKNDVNENTYQYAMGDTEQPVFLRAKK